MLNIRMLSFIASGFLFTFALSGCGFKSDLVLPESESADSLFEADTQPVVETDGQSELLGGQEIMLEEILPLSPTSESDGVPIDITSIASDGQILVSPDDAKVDAFEGVPVSIDDLFNAEEESSAQ